MDLNRVRAFSLSDATLKLDPFSRFIDLADNGAVDWADGTAPTISTSNGADDFFVFATSDGGTIWYGFTAGQDLK